MKLYSSDYSKLISDSILIDFQMFKDEEDSEAIGGVMPKMFVKEINDTLVKGSGKYNEFIAKSSISEDEDLIANEHFFIWLSSACDIDTSEAVLLIDSNTNAKILLSKIFIKDDEVLIHFVNTLKKEDKQDITIGKFLSAIGEKQRFVDDRISMETDILKQLYFSNLVGNYDFHSRNIALLQSPTETVVAPSYDVSCTKYYDNSTRSAIKVNGKIKDVTPDDILSDFIEFSMLSREKILSVFVEINNDVKENIKQIEASHMDREEIDFIKEYIDEKLSIAFSAIEANKEKMSAHDMEENDAIYMGM